MIAEQIKDVKKFMSKLLMEKYFDEFLVNEISISTYSTFTIDGHINNDFFSESELADLQDKHLSSWNKIKPICFNIIKGNKTPLKFRFIFAMNRTFIKYLIVQNNISINEEIVNELFLNIKFENGMLNYTTGVSLKEFTLDKTIEKYFDNYILNFISTLV